MTVADYMVMFLGEADITWEEWKHLTLLNKEKELLLVIISLYLVIESRIRCSIDKWSKSYPCGVGSGSFEGKDAQ